MCPVCWHVQVVFQEFGDVSTIVEMKDTWEEEMAARVVVLLVLTVARVLTVPLEAAFQGTYFHIGSLLVPEFVFISGYKYSTLGLKQNVKWKAFNYILESNVKTRQSRISRFTNWGEATFLRSATCRTVGLPAFSFILHNPQAPFKRNKLINEPFDFILLQNFTDVSWGWFICDISIKSKASLHFYLKQWQKNIWKSLPACLGPCLPGPPSVMQSSSYLRCR